MSDPAIDTAPAATSLKRHPIRGALWGLPLGLGVALVLIGQKIIALGTLPPIIVIAGGVVLGIVWAMVGPAKAPKGARPVAPIVATPEDSTPVAPPAPSPLPPPPQD